MDFTYTWNGYLALWDPSTLWKYVFTMLVLFSTNFNVPFRGKKSAQWKTRKKSITWEKALISHTTLQGSLIKHSIIFRYKYKKAFGLHYFKVQNEFNTDELNNCLRQMGIKRLRITERCMIRTKMGIIPNKEAIILKEGEASNCNINILPYIMKDERNRFSSMKLCEYNYDKHLSP